MGNNGWGLREMIIYMCILIIILLFVAISINSLYRRIDKDSNNAKSNPVIVEPAKDEEPAEELEEEKPREVNYDYYRKIEQNLYDATNKYLDDNPTFLGDNILKLDAETLVGLGYMDDIYNDAGTDKCLGYSNVYINFENGNYVINSYIRCDNYVSSGY